MNKRKVIGKLDRLEKRIDALEARPVTGVSEPIMFTPYQTYPQPYIGDPVVNPWLTISRKLN